MKIKISIIINLLIFVLMIFGLMVALLGIPFLQEGSKSNFLNLIKYFTVESNIFMGITALIFAINEILYIKKGKKINKIIFILKYVSTVCVAITFFTVVFFLAPLVYRDRALTMFTGINFFYHVAIPVLSIIVFILFENSNQYNIKITIFGMILFLIYSIFYLIASLTHIEDGKIIDGYDWYGFLKFGIPMFFLLMVLMLVLSYSISFLLYYINKKLFKEN